MDIKANVLTKTLRHIRFLTYNIYTSFLPSANETHAYCKAAKNSERQEKDKLL